MDVKIRCFKIYIWKRENKMVLPASLLEYQDMLIHNQDNFRSSPEMVWQKWYITVIPIISHSRMSILIFSTSYTPEM